MKNKYLIDTNLVIYYFNTPDAIIGATALIHGFEIVTNNADDFKKLDLKIITAKVKE